MLVFSTLNTPYFGGRKFLITQTKDLGTFYGDLHDHFFDQDANINQAETL